MIQVLLCMTNDADCDEIYIHVHIYISNFRSQITYLFVKCGYSICCFPHSLICRGTDISKCFSESLGIRGNESRLYYKHTKAFVEKVYLIGRGCRFSSCTDLKMENNQFCK